MAAQFVRYTLQRGPGGERDERTGRRNGGLVLAEFERNPRLEGWRKPLEIRHKREELKDEEEDQRPRWQARGLAPYRRQDVWLVQETAKAVAKAPQLGEDPQQFVGRPKAQGGFREQFFLFRVKRPPPLQEVTTMEDDIEGDGLEGSITVQPLADWQVFRARRSQRELDQSLDEIADRQKQRLVQEKTRQNKRKSKLATLLRAKRAAEEDEDLEDNVQDDIAYRHQGNVYKMLKEKKLAESLGKKDDEFARHDEDDIQIEERGSRADATAGFVDDGEFRDYGEDGDDFKPVYLGSDDEVENADEEGMAEEIIDPDDNPFAYQHEEEEEGSEEEEVASGDASDAEGSEEEADTYGKRKRGAEDSDEGALSKKAKKTDGLEAGGGGDGPLYAVDPLTGFRQISQDSVIHALREYGQVHSGVTREEFLKPFQQEIEAALNAGDNSKAKFIARKIREHVREVSDRLNHPTKGTVYKLRAQYF